MTLYTAHQKQKVTSAPQSQTNKNVFSGFLNCLVIVCDLKNVLCIFMI